MMSSQIISPFPQFTGLDGEPLEAGYIYIGEANQNPETNPIAVYWDDDLSIPAAQPLRTISGYIARSGAPGSILTAEDDYSITVRDRSKRLIFTTESATGVGNFREALSDDTDPTKGASLVGYYDFAAPAYLKTVSDIINGIQVQIFRFIPRALHMGIRNRTDATNLTPYINDAMSSGLRELQFVQGTYWIDEAFPGAGYAIDNPGVSMTGEGIASVRIHPKATMPNTCDFMRVRPTGGAYIDFLTIRNLLIDPKAGGATAYGKRGIYFLFDTATNLTELYLAHNYILPGNDYSVRFENNSVANPQGVPANTTIERNAFWEGVQASYLGDSVNFLRNVFRSTDASGRIGLNLYITDVSGTASHCVIEGNNMDCDGGAIFLATGRNVKIVKNNIEQSHGAGSIGAVINLDGSSGALVMPEVRSNHIGIFGTATVDRAIRVHSAAMAIVDDNTILSGLTCDEAILITSSAQDAFIGANEIQSTYTTQVNNGGERTRGVNIPLTPQNGFANSGGYQPVTIIKDRYGKVTLSGVMSCPALPNGKTIAALGVGYRPTVTQRIACGAVVSGSVAPQAIEIRSGGDIVYQGSDSATRIEFCVTFPTPSNFTGSL